MTVTPVLADQLEAPGVGRAHARLRCASYRLGSRARRDAEARERRAARRRAGRGRSLPARARAPRRARRRPARARSAAAQRERAGRADGVGARPTRCCRCVATDRRAGGCRSTPACARTARRFGAGDGLLAARVRVRARPRALLAERGLELLLRRPERARGPRWPRSRPARPAAGPVAFTIDWEAVSLVWSRRRLSLRPRLPRVPPPVAQRDPAVGDRRRALRPGRGRADAPASTRASSSPRSRSALRAHSRASAAAPGLVVVRDRHRAARALVERGPGVAARPSLERRAERGVGLVTLPRRSPSATSRSRGALRRSSWGEAKDLRTWDSPAVADLAWARAPARAAAAAGARRGGLRARPRRARGARAARGRSRATGRSSTPARAGGRLRLPARGRARSRRCSRP